MKTYNIILSFLIIIHLISCSKINRQEKTYYELQVEINNNILNRQNIVIPDSLFCFFPQESDSEFMTKTTTKISNIYRFDSLQIKYFAPSNYLSQYFCNNESVFNAIVEKLKNNSIAKTKIDSNDYMLITNQNTLFSIFDTLQLKTKYQKYKDKVFVPDFATDKRYPVKESDTLTLCGLPSTSEILLLKSGNDFVLPEDLYYNWDILPEDIRHGYRAGVAFKQNELYLIYWVVAW
jgi:hypothetical protein